jgi:hypothetical protein
MKLFETPDNPIKWIHDLLVPGPAGRGGNDYPWPPLSTWHYVPPVFEAYVKILHPAFEDPAITDRTVTWNETEKRGERRGIGDDLIAPYYEYGRQAFERRLLPISWRDLAKRYGVLYEPDINPRSFRSVFPDGWPRFLWNLSEGELALAERTAIAETLAAEFGNVECTSYFFIMAMTDPILTSGYSVARGPILEAPTLPTAFEELRTSPNYWFPDDHSWLVVTDYDGDETFVGGPARLIDALCARSELQLFRVEADTVVTR